MCLHVHGFTVTYLFPLLVFFVPPFFVCQHDRFLSALTPITTENPTYVLLLFLRGLWGFFENFSQEVFGYAADCFLVAD